MNDKSGLHNPSPWLGRALCIITALLWSTSGVLIKKLTGAEAGWPGIQVAGVRSLLAAITLMIFGAIWLRRPNAGEQEQGRSAGRARLVIAVFYAATILTYVLAQTYTATANAIFLQYTNPIYVMVLSTWILHEKPRVADYLTLPLVIVGIVLIMTAGLNFSHGHFGNVLGLASGIGQALLILFIRKWRNRGIQGGVVLGNIMVAAVMMGVLCFRPHDFVPLNLSTALQILWLGIIQIGVSYILFIEALKRVRAVEVALLTFVEPVVAPIWAWIFVADKPPAASIIGGCVILAGITANSIWKARTGE